MYTNQNEHIEIHLSKQFEVTTKNMLNLHIPANLQCWKELLPLGICCQRERIEHAVGADHDLHRAPRTEAECAAHKEEMRQALFEVRQQLGLVFLHRGIYGVQHNGGPGLGQHHLYNIYEALERVEF
jgi:hypothetical protein